MDFIGPGPPPPWTDGYCGNYSRRDEIACTGSPGGKGGFVRDECGMLRAM